MPPDTLLSLPKSQVKRQEVISELLVTEAAHVRMLRVLHDLFYQPMADGGFFPLDELQNIFPSLDELIEVHCECQPQLPPFSSTSQYQLPPPGLLDPEPATGSLAYSWGPHIPVPHSIHPRGTDTKQAHKMRDSPPAPRIKHITAA